MQYFALSQGFLKETGGRSLEVVRAGVPGMQYYLLGQRVCRYAFAKLHTASWAPRLGRIYEAVMSGARSCPTDGRFGNIRKLDSCTSEAWSNIYSYLHTLYESVAETLPDDSDAEAVGGTESDCDNLDIDQDMPASCSANKKVQYRKLPPGTIHDQWKQYRALGGQGGSKLFYRCWREEFWYMKFRRCRNHAQCSVCLRHKLLIKTYSNDLHARTKQRRLYEDHLKSQYEDRKVYWQWRAEARLHRPVICIVLDGADQAKFGWPRSPIFESHDFDGMQRPRLHVWGAIAHGMFSFLGVMHADVCKSGSTTCEILAHLFTLVSQKTELWKCHLHVQLDNTSGTNKNNTVLAFLAMCVAMGLVTTCSLCFLRPGHTHEDIDQLFGSLAAYVKRMLPVAHSMADFIKCFEDFFEKLKRPHEPVACVRRIDHIRDWKGYFASMGRHLCGIGGPSAPKVFNFIRRKG